MSTNFQNQNLLPNEGDVRYFGKILSEKESSFFFTKLLDEIEWKQDEVMMFGKRIVTRRMTGWYADEEFIYTYSKISRKAKVWTPQLHNLKSRVEEVTKMKFNSCLLNRYPTGEEGMSWHSDAEAELGKNPVIASVSLGAQRRFVLKNKISAEKVALELEDGSLLLMQGTTQKNWLHSLPKSKKVQEPRINLTFRNIVKFKK